MFLRAFVAPVRRALQRPNGFTGFFCLLFVPVCSSHSRRALKTILFFTGVPFAPSHTVFQRQYSRKASNNDKEDPRLDGIDEIFDQAEHGGAGMGKGFGGGGFQDNIMPQHPPTRPEDRFDDDDYEVSQMRSQMGNLNNEPLSDEWIFDRAKESYFNPLTKEVKMPFWKSKQDYQARRASRYSQMTEEQDKRPLPFYGDTKYDDDTQFYWDSEMVRIRNRYNYLGMHSYRVFFDLHETNPHTTTHRFCRTGESTISR